MMRLSEFIVLAGLLIISVGQHTRAAEKRAGKTIFAYNEQLILHVDKPLHLIGERIHFKVYAIARNEGGMRSSVSRVAYIELLDRANVPVIQLKVGLADGVGSGTLDIPKHLDTDYYVLRAYTNWMKNSGPSCFFHHVLTIVNPFLPIRGRKTTASPVGISDSDDLTTDQRLEISGTADARVYGKREQVAIRLSAHDLSGKPVGANLSVSVYRMDELQQAGYGHVQPLVGNPMAPISAGSGAQHPLEREGPFIIGKVVDRVTGTPQKGVTAYLSAIGDPSVFCSATSDATGRVVFNPPRLVGYLEGVIQLVGTDSLSRIVLENSFSESYLSLSLPEISLSPALGSLLNAYSIRLQLEASFKHPDTLATSVWQPFYGKADQTYRLEDYTQFASLRDIFREYVLEVAPRGVEDHFTLRLLNKAEDDMFERNPLILYDGVPVFDAYKLMDMNPREIERFDVVAARYYHGNAECDGILSFKSHQGNFHRSLFDPSALVIDLMGTQPAGEIDFPAHDSGGQHERMPDLRSMLYWNPLVRTDTLGVAAVEFVTSDVSGTFTAVVQGVDATGKRGCHTFTFEVK